MSNVSVQEASAPLNSPFPERSIRTYEDWHAFVAKVPATKPEIPSHADFLALTKAKQKEVNQKRVHYINSFGPINVPAMEEIHDAGMRLASSNLRAQPGARSGLIIDGVSTVGKSTIAMQFGRRYELKITKDHTIKRTPTGHVFVPVAFVNLPAEMSIMNFNYLLAKFFNIPFSRSDRELFLSNAIKEAAADCGTSLFILDDIHFLQIKNRIHATLNNHIKHLANSISATFVYAGIDLQHTGLLTEGQSKEKGTNTQTGHRFKKFDLTEYSMATNAGKKNFKELLNFFEEHIGLYLQSPGSLFSEFAPYILDRTSGYIGPISNLLRECGNLAIRSGTECFSIGLFEKIRLDHDSEAAYRQKRKIKQASAQRSST